MKRFLNLSTCVMLAVIVIAVISAVLSSTINWVAIIWMVIAAMWVVCARSNQMTAEDWKQLYDSQSKTFNTLRQRWTSTNDELVELRGKYQALDNEYLKLAKEHEATVKENAQNLEAKKPGTKTTKREYSEQDQARIREEMKSAGMKPKTKKRRPVEDED